LASSAYVARECELEIERSVATGQWVVLLGPRQHGKTSVLIRIRERLRDSFNIPCALIDLSAVAPAAEYAQHLRIVSERIAISMGVPLRTEVPDNTDLSAWLSTLVLPERKPVVVMIDEAAGGVSKLFRETFYGQIRSISTERAYSSSGSLPNRICFIFAGTFRPESLVDPRNSPFNVCREIESDDLSAEGAATLWRNVTGFEGQDVANAVLDEVGGQPFLIQYLYSKTSAASAHRDRLAVLSSAIRELHRTGDSHLRSLFSHITNDPVLTSHLRRLCADGRLPSPVIDADLRFMCVLGLAKATEGGTVFRNKLYENAAKGYLKEQLRQRDASLHNDLVNRLREVAVTDGRKTIWVMPPAFRAIFQVASDIMIRDPTAEMPQGAASPYAAPITASTQMWDRILEEVASRWNR